MDCHAYDAGGAYQAGPKTNTLFLDLIPKFVACFPYMMPGTKGKEKLVVLHIVNLLDFLALEGPEHLQLLLLVFKEMVVGWLCWLPNGLSCAASAAAFADDW
ncbi:hypothetical protein HAX54_004637 [Datura stramonium]|uniref:Uncharacterized protein n=1 Tax=Datura stramonium TaxID=4076 RepID=A0ABS8YB81_DATST|nr:hypothetical protein [Datura stramonium]